MVLIDNNRSSTNHSGSAIGEESIHNNGTNIDDDVHNVLSQDISSVKLLDPNEVTVATMRKTTFIRKNSKLKSNIKMQEITPVTNSGPAHATFNNSLNSSALNSYGGVVGVIGTTDNHATMQHNTNILTSNQPQT